MSLAQWFAKTFLPRSASDAMRKESEAWLLHCPACSGTQSVWETGGIRFGAASVGKKVMARCRHCGQLHMMPMKKKSDAE